MIDYQISAKTGDAAYSVLGTSTVTSYTASSLKADTVYNFKVAARNSVGFSPDSTEVKNTVTVKETPKTPDVVVPASTGKMPKPENWEISGISGAIFKSYEAVDTILMAAMTPMFKYGVFAWSGPMICLTSPDYMLKWFGIDNVKVTEEMR